jgi:hypothetical protein
MTADEMFNLTDEQRVLLEKIKTGLYYQTIFDLILTTLLITTAFYCVAYTVMTGGDTHALQFAIITFGSLSAWILGTHNTHSIVLNSILVSHFEKLLFNHVAILVCTVSQFILFAIAILIGLN